MAQATSKADSRRTTILSAKNLRHPEMMSWALGCLSYIAGNRLILR
jgi:hypothetical protein